MKSVITAGLTRLKSPYTSIKHAAFYKTNIYPEYKIVKQGETLFISAMTHGPIKDSSDYHPFTNPQLFSQFSRLQTDEDIIKFISKNGFLLNEDNETNHKEDYDFFVSEVKKARQLYDLLNLIIKKDKKKIKDRLQIKRKLPSSNSSLESYYKLLNIINECHFRIFFDNVEYTPPGDLLDHWNKYVESKILDYAFFFLVEQVAEKLTGKLHLDFNTIVPCDDGALNFRPIPAYSFDDLLTVMYFSFYGLLSNGIDVRACEFPECGNRFMPERKNIKYCPDCLAKHGNNIYMAAKRMKK